MSIGTRIKEARRAKHIKQHELASMIGVTKAAISNYENDVSMPKPELFYELMKALDVDANYLYQDLAAETIDNFIVSLSEKELIMKYRKLTTSSKDAINGLLDNLYLRDNAEEEA